MDACKESLSADARPDVDAGARQRGVQDRDRIIQAWAYLSPQEPRDIPSKDGPLAGLTFGVKDVIDVKDMPTMCGASIPWPERRRLDAACVAQLRAAGAVPIGKTVTAQFAYMTPGPTRNPWKPAHTPGGSSSGSAAAVAAGMVEFALGTQTGGSIVRPAAFNGVVGFKPSFGTVHRAGMAVLCDSLDTIGWFTRELGLSRRIAQVFLPEPASPAPSSRALRLAVLPCVDLRPAGMEAHAVLHAAVEALRPHCADVDVLTPDGDVADLLALHGVIMHYELARGLLPVLRDDAAALSSTTAEAVRKGLGIDAAAYQAAQRRRKALALRWENWLGRYDAILTPSAPGAAPAGLESTGSSIFNRIWSLLGWPAVHLPCAFSPEGLPLGVQCVGRPFEDTELLALAEGIHTRIDRRGDKAHRWPA